MPDAPSDLDALEGQLATRPDDVELRERVARMAVRVGRPDAALKALRGFVNLTAHDGGPLPCLCRRCFAPEIVEAEAQGQRFRRDFTVAQGRVLHYWLPVDLADRARRTARSVGAALKVRLAHRERRPRR